MYIIYVVLKARKRDLLKNSRTTICDHLSAISEHYPKNHNFSS